jgi:hypothetical protein
VSLNGFEDEVAVGCRVSSTDQPDGVGNHFFEIAMGKSGHFDFGVEVLEAIEFTLVILNDVGGIGGEKFLGLPNLTNLKVLRKDSEKVGDQGNTFGEGKVDDLDFVPIGKGPVCDDEGVGVANSGEEFVDGWVQDSFLDHGCGEFVRPIRNRPEQMQRRESEREIGVGAQDFHEGAMAFEGLESLADFGIFAMTGQVDVENVFPVFLFGGAGFNF